jgi:pimeloyl-ACP methyl ester carboxylesterase
MPEELRFRSGEECAATLYRPRGTTDGDVPCVVMANGFSLTRRDGLPLFAERFAAAGLAVLAFDFRHLGESSGEPRQLVDVRRQRADLVAAVAAARTLEGIDPRRIALWGFSLGGGLAIRVAADDGRLAAAVALCPLADGLAFAMASDPRATARLTAASVHEGIVRRPVRVPAVGPPGSFAVLNQPEVLPGFAAVRARDSLWRNEACAGPFVRAALFRPVRVAHRVGCPLMLCAGDDDTVVPQGPIVRAARRAPHGELHRFPIGHFDAFRVGEGFERVATEQERFLARHLSVAQQSRPRVRAA